MDIDEFLDREIADLGVDSCNDEKSLDSAAKSEIDQSALFQSAKFGLGTANLENAEQSYTQLWVSLMQQKLKWNKELYDQLSTLSKQFSSILSQSYDELKKKANHIYDLISRARKFIQDGKNDAAYKIYSEVQAMSNTMPNIFFEEKRYVQEQILSLYRDLNNTTDSELIKKVSGMMQEINAAIDKINASLSSNDVANASDNYNKCIELYNQVPQGFLKTKNLAGIKLLEIYRSLSIYLEISRLQNQLGRKVPQFQQTMPKAPVSYEKNSRYGRLRSIRLSQEKSSQKTETAAPEAMTSYILAGRKREHAKKNIKKGFYNEAWKDIEEALQIDPSDVEAKALKAKIKTLQ